MEAIWEGGRLVAEVTAYRPGRRRAVVRTPSAAVLRSLELPRAHVRGELRVGERVHVTFRHRRSLPRKLEFRCIWRVGHVQQPIDGPYLTLTPRMAHQKIQVTVRVRAPGYRWAQTIAGRSSPVSP
jgi:hypothetical protein